jgi:hypothetical protein
MSTVTFRASGSFERVEDWVNAIVTVDTSDAFAVLSFIGLERETFGAVDARDFAPLLRRALWPSRNTPSHLRDVLIALLGLAERAGHDEGLIIFSIDNEIAMR